jgi:hypothetical protein
MTTYSLAGLRIVSDLPLPGLVPCGYGSEVSTWDEIVIRRARVPASLSAVRAAFPGGQCNENELLLIIPGVGKYLLRHGNEILVEQAPSSNPPELAAYLLGTMFGVLCHQRTITPLHASAIDFADGSVAFIGESGAGKSTLVASLASRGHEVIADDICFLKLGNKREVQAWPGVNRIRLWQDAVTALGCKRAGIERVWNGWTKYFIPVHRERNPLGPRRLHRVYQLHTARDDSLPTLNRLHGAAAIEVLMQNVYRIDLAEQMGLKSAAFILCAAVARTVPVFRFSRPISFNALRQGVDLLEDHLRDIC